MSKLTGCSCKSSMSAERPDMSAVLHSAVSGKTLRTLLHKITRQTTHTNTWHKWVDGATALCSPSMVCPSSPPSTHPIIRVIRREVQCRPREPVNGAHWHNPPHKSSMWGTCRPHTDVTPLVSSTPVFTVGLEGGWFLTCDLTYIWRNLFLVDHSEALGFQMQAVVYK